MLIRPGTTVLSKSTPGALPRLKRRASPGPTPRALPEPKRIALYGPTPRAPSKPKRIALPGPILIGLPGPTPRAPPIKQHNEIQNYTKIMVIIKAKRQTYPNQ